MNPPSERVPTRVQLPETGVPYARLLDGAPVTAGMRCGCVTLAPGTAVGLHSTEDREEILVPLAGNGELRVPGYENLTVTPGWVLYNPPHTRHDVVNTGQEPLRYLYIVATAGGTDQA